METIYSKGKAYSRSETDAMGNVWMITTSKNDRSGAVECNAVQGQSDGNMISYAMFGAKRLSLASEPGNATEAKIARVHAAGLVEFEKKLAEMPKAKPVEIGQVIFSITGHDGPQNRRAVWSIPHPGQFETVLLDGSDLRHDERVKEYTGKDGIGSYFAAGHIIPAEELQALKERATKAKQEREEAREREATEKAETKQRNILAGAKIIAQIPEGVEAIIVAEEREDTSDSMSDYWGYKTTKVVYLAWSRHKKDLFTEMRDAAKLFTETADLAEAGPDFEHREKYSMGAGYYLGKSKYSGWVVSKENIPSLEPLQIAAAEGRFLCKELRQAAAKSEAVTGTTVRLNPEHDGIEIHFPGKPDADTLADLKSNGWRWARFNKCWYRKDSPSARKFAERYGFKAEAVNHDAALVEAQENASFERFAADNL